MNKASAHISLSALKRATLRTGGRALTISMLAGVLATTGATLTAATASAFHWSSGHLRGHDRRMRSHGRRVHRAALLMQAKRHRTGSTSTTASTTSTTTAATTTTTTSTSTSTTTSSTTTTTPSSSSPSGASMPVGDIPGWHQVFADDFNGTSLDTSHWNKYSGQPGGDPGGWWDPRHVTVANGLLSLNGYKDPNDGGKWTTGGVSTTPGLTQTYGKYLVRFRMDSGVGIAHVILLWPADGSWPPEVDFSEDNGSDRQSDFGTLHYGANNSTIGSSVAVDLTQWHTLGVEWTPGKLVYTIDGRNWATTTNANVPSIPMVLALQTQAWACGVSTWEQCPNSTTPANVNMYVDWVAAYSPTS